MLANTSPRRKAGAIIHNSKSSSQAKRQDGVNTESIHIQLFYHGLVAYIIKFSDCKVTKAVAMKHLREKDSLLESSTLIYRQTASADFFNLLLRFINKAVYQLSQHVWEACGRSLPKPKDTPGLSSTI